MNTELREAIRKVREAAAQSRNVKLDSPLWKAIADLCAVADKELPSLADAIPDTTRKET